MQTEKRLTEEQLRIRERNLERIKRSAARRIKKMAIANLKVNIFFFLLGVGTSFFCLTYSSAMDINCLAEKGYAPQFIVEPYNNMLLKVRTL